MSSSTLPLRNKRVVVAVMHVSATDGEGGHVYPDSEIAAWVADNLRDAGWDPVGITVYGGFLTEGNS